VVPELQLFDVIADESERNNLATTSPELVDALMAVVKRYNSTGTVRVFRTKLALEASEQAWEPMVVFLVFTPLTGRHCKFCPNTEGEFVDPLFYKFPVETDCPFNDEHGNLTPCPV
jgi:hypothetical protein